MKSNISNRLADAWPLRPRALLFMTWLLACWAPAASAQTIGVLGTSPETAKPVYASQSTDIAPLVMLVMARDHSLFYPAYNDWSDLNGDGVIDYSFNNDIEYLGIYNSYHCYIETNDNSLWYLTSHVSNKRPNFYFGLKQNAALRFNSAGVKVPGVCDSNSISGNFLNWATTSRMDAIRIALYGGQRSTDLPNGLTKLRRAYIPMDGHAWSKVYSDTYANMANLTWNGLTYDRFAGQRTNAGAKPGSLGCVNISDCKNQPPSLLYTSNPDSSGNVPLDPTDGGFTIPPVFSALDQRIVSNVREKYVVAESCVAPFLSGCSTYYNSDGTLNGYKPTGVLQEYGEGGKIKFGLITGSYDSNLSGGILRKNIGSFDGEINPSTGQLTGSAESIIKQIDNFAIRNFNNGFDSYSSPNYLYLNGWTYTKRMLREGYYNDWGNPIAEMMYEGLRYFKGSVAGAFGPIYDGGSPSGSAAGAGDSAIGLAKPNWQDAYSQDNVCAKPNLLVISGPNSFDSDELPGAHPDFISNPFNNLQQKNRAGSLANVNGQALNVTTLANNIGTAERVSSHVRFIGHQAGLNYDYAPSIKSITNLGEIRGLAPDGANSEGSYYSASVAAFGKSAPLRSVAGVNIPTVDTYALQFPHDAPVINVPIAGKIITIIPFSKTMIPSGYGSNARGEFQPTGQILGAHIRTLTDPKNTNGQFYLEMDVNFNESSWGGSHAMSAVARYKISGQNNRVTVSVKVIKRDEGRYGTFVTDALNGAQTITNYATGEAPARQHVGYIISGTTNKDGLYLVATDANADSDSFPYFLNVPDAAKINDCYYNALKSGCGNLAGFNVSSSNREFTANVDPFDILLKDPLWFAAKWGGYADGVPPFARSTDNPDNFVDLTNPANLKTGLRKMLDKMLDVQHFKAGTVSNGQQVIGKKIIYSTEFDLKTNGGVLTATPFTVLPGANSESVSYLDRWSTSNTLLKEAGRNIYYKNPGSSALKSFTFANLDADYAGKFASAALVQYLRGGRSGEMVNRGAYRNRSSILGMTVNSLPVYSSDTDAVYVAANDGMLHAFNALDGVEKFAYVPTSAINGTNNLSLLARPGYTHRYFLDGNIAVSKSADTGGVNYLVGFMGRAAKGMYGLKVNYAGVNTSAGTWENFGVGDNDMGYLLGQPLITKLSDNTPVVVFGNGYNSINNKAVLYVARLSDGAVLARFSSNAGSAAAPNGLATPGLVTNANGQVQYAYAGDYLGNVWKFSLASLTNAVTASPPVATLVFTTTDPSNKAQPITVAITPSVSSAWADSVVANKKFLFFGTGSDLTASDLASTQTQSMYGLIDAGNLVAKTGLTQRSINPSGTYSVGAATYAVRSFSRPVSGPNDMAGKSGWYMNWSANGTTASEKVLGAATVRAGAVQPLVVSSNVVDRTGCGGPNDTGYLNVMDAFHGGGLSESYLDINRNGSYADETYNNNGAKVIGSISYGIGVLGQASFYGENMLLHGSATNATTGSDNADAATKAFNGRKLRRISWREIVQ